MFVDRRKANRHVLAALVFVIFVLLGAFAIVVGVLVEQNHQLRQQGVRIESIALDAEEAAKGAKRVAEESQPCTPDSPSSPACQRAARTESVLTRAIDLVRQALAAGLEAHDLNTHRQHEDLRRRVASAPAMAPVERTPITPAVTAPSSTIPATTTTTAAPVEAPRSVLTVPTTLPPVTAPPPIVPVPRLDAPCPTLPNGRCHPGRSQGGGR